MAEPKTKIKLIPGEKNLYIDRTTGFYIARVYSGGRTFQKTLLATGKTAARLEKDEFIVEVKKEARGIPVAKNMPSLLKAIDEWQTVKAGENTERYLRVGATNLKKILKLILHVQIDKVSTGQLNECLQNYYSKPYTKGGITKKHTERTFNYHVMLLKSLFRFFYDTEKIQINPADRVKRLRQPELSRNVINPNTNSDTFFEEVDKQNLFYMSFLTRAMFYLGLRIDEAVKMKWSNYDDKLNKYTPGKMTRTKGKEVASLKVPEVFISWIDKAKEIKNLVYICPNQETNLPYSSSVVQERLQRISVALGYKIKPHDLRASFITTLSEVYDLPTVKDLARHSDISTTMIYIPRNQKRMDEAMDSVFSKKA